MKTFKSMLPAHVVCKANTPTLNARDVARAWRKAGRPPICYFAGNPSHARGWKGYSAPVAYPSLTGAWGGVA